MLIIFSLGLLLKYLSIVPIIVVLMPTWLYIKYKIYIIILGITLYTMKSIF